ncbi:hypothetical protein D9619_011661 [Psilocybe cf. subviscida]|uniref:Rpr2-domain-containing protein n=1 Tax=Psilocybe cf. subviscida TaxID=2480587 RepID=A0A8H5BSK9_9AGAR|nr:hypothetical protein D9619_011661 [Psilocybe cf. subviscida]
MVKKQKEEIPNVNATANRDIVQRLNFLYQASVYLQSIAPPSAETIAERNEARKLDNNIGEGSSTAQRTTQRVRKRVKQRNVAKKSTADLARSYVQCMHVVGQKTTVKTDPSLKRTLCSYCSTTLVSGSSASVRVKSSRPHGHVMVYTCLHCKHSKRIPAPGITSPAPMRPLPFASAIASPKPNVDAKRLSSIDTAAPPSQSGTVITSTKEEPAFRQPPLFARIGAGHVTFRGNTQLPVDPQSGFGTFLV